MFRLGVKEKTKVTHPVISLEYGQYPLCKTERVLQAMTSTALASSAFKISKDGLQILKHRDRLVEARHEINHWFTDEEVKKVQRAGFEWFAFLSFIKRFKYHASISESPCCVCRFGGGGTHVIYTGDIPDFALDRIKVIKKLPLYHVNGIYKQWWEGLDDLSIHSMQPLPVEYRGGDPVVIAWKFNPSIWLEADGTLAVPHIYHWDMMGVVIGAWDKEAELK